MKKLMVAALLAVIAGVSAFADCLVEKKSDGRFDITWTYNNPRAEEVYLAGDFTNWDQGKTLMEKTETGWTFQMNVPSGTVFKYKFVVDGTWTSDNMAPAFESDGLGGQNGVVNVDKAWKLHGQPAPQKLTKEQKRRLNRK